MAPAATTRWTAAVATTPCSGADIMNGAAGNDTLSGLGGVDILQGGTGDDAINDTSGVGLFNGGAGADTLTGGSSVEVYIGGQGNDTLTTGAGNDILLFNQGDGQDTVAAGGTGSDVLSLGGGIAYSDLSLSKSNNDLVLAMGGNDQITFKNWYAATPSKPLVTLQMVAELAPGYVAGGTDSLLDNKIETFNFAGLVTDFDAARAANANLTQWSLTNTLANRHQGGSDTAALGGDLAYQYGKTGNLSAIGVTAAQSLLSDVNLGSQAQSLQSPASLETGAVRLT